MALEVIGRLKQKLTAQSGTSSRGEWVKQEFIIQTEDTYPKQICMSVWGKEKADKLNAIQEESLVKCSINIESREYNGRWYTDIRAWKIELADSGAATDAHQPAAQPESYDPRDLDPDSYSDMPF